MVKIIFITALLFVGFFSCQKGPNLGYCAKCQNLSITNNDSVVSSSNACSKESENIAEEEARRKLPNDSNTITKCEITVAE